MLNKLLDMSDGSHLRKRDMQIMIKLLKVKYGPEATSTLRNNEHWNINQHHQKMVKSLPQKAFHPPPSE